MSVSKSLLESLHDNTKLNCIISIPQATKTFMVNEMVNLVLYIIELFKFY